MSKTNELRKNAENCRGLAEATEGPNKARYNRMAESWNNLANTQEWIEGELADGTGGNSSQPQDSNGG